MSNELFSIGPITVYGYGLMIALGVIAAYVVAEYRAKKMGLNHDIIFNLTIWCALGGILGAKLLFYITTLPDIIADPSIMLNVFDGFVVYGGIIGGIFSGYLFCKKNDLDFLEYFDLVMPSIALAQGIGRIGCVFAGCCYGHETDGSFHIIFNGSDYAPNGIPLLPTQYISSGLNILHFIVLIWFAKHKKANGQVASLYLILYGIGRFILEFYRGDLERGSVGTLSTSQFISIFIVIAGIILFVERQIRGKKLNAGK